MTESLLARLKSQSRLPTPQGTALNIIRLCQEEDVSATELANTISADPALSLRLLRYANSSLFGVRKEVTNIRDAVVLLGLRAVRLTALSFSLITSDDPRACKNFDFTRFWSHSLAAAVAARHLAKFRRQVHPEEAFAAALLARIGRLVFAVGLPQEYAAVLDTSGGTLGETSTAETAVFGVSYPRMGAELIRDWGIPEKLAAAVEHQFNPAQIAQDPELRQLAALIGPAGQVADVICEAFPPDQLSAAKEALVGTTLAGLPVPAEEAFKGIHEEYNALASTLKFKERSAVNAVQIQAAAGEVLGELRMAEHAARANLKKQCGDLDGSSTDPLTGLPTRAIYDRKVQQIWAQTTRAGRKLGLVFIDVDGFQKFNATYGRPAGDAVLRLVGASLIPLLRENDLAGRYSGDEFAMLLPNIDRMILAQTCVRIRKAIEGATINVAGKYPRVTVSLGAALLSRPPAHFTLADFITAAQQELRAARAKGGNTCSMRHIHAEPPITAGTKP